MISEVRKQSEWLEGKGGSRFNIPGKLVRTDVPSDVLEPVEITRDLRNSLWSFCQRPGVYSRVGGQGWLSTSYS